MALGWVCVALVSIMGLVGMAFDVGTLEIAAQRCQEVADSSALGAATELPTAAVTPTALDIVSANNTDGRGWGVTCDETDVALYGPGATVAGVTLDANSNAVEVTVHGPVQFGFIRLVGLEEATAHRTAIAMRGTKTSGYPFVPIWIDVATAMDAEYAPGATNILMADGPTYPGVPGTFGFLNPPADASFRELLNGSNLTEQQMNECVSEIGDYVYAEPGLNVGQWSQELQDRIDIGSSGIYEGDTAESFTDGNPRVIICPIVEYVDAGGANAHFEVLGYATFFLEAVVNITGDKAIQATFIDYYIPGDETWGTPTYEGFFTVKLIE